MAELLVPAGSKHSQAHLEAHRVNHLWRCALGVLPHSRPLARAYTRALCASADAGGLDVDFARSCFCAACYLPFVPGVTCRVALHRRGTGSQAHARARRHARRARAAPSDFAPAQEVAYTCLDCGHITAISGGSQKQHQKKLQKRREQRRACALVASEAKQSHDRNRKRQREKEAAAAAAAAAAAQPEKLVPRTSLLDVPPRRKKKKKKKAPDPPSGLTAFLGSL